jgi:hypothetical protein
MGEGEVWFTGTSAFPDIVKSVEDVPKARVLQLSSGTSSYSLDSLVNGKI